jgi:hypothetical protein
MTPAKKPQPFMEFQTPGLISNPLSELMTGMESNMKSSEQNITRQLDNISLREIHPNISPNKVSPDKSLSIGQPTFAIKPIIVLPPIIQT